MKSNPIARPAVNDGRLRALGRVLEQSEHINELVRQSAEELAAVNRVLQRALENGKAPPAMENAFEQSVAVKKKVVDAANKLAILSRALENEVRDRALVEHQLAAACEQEDAARYAAFHDVLTGLPNRALFTDRLEHGLAQAKRHDWTLAVMFIDLGKFKAINDTYGHGAGDHILQTVAQRLRENTRGDDTVSRYGGDEFLYLLTEVEDDQIVAMIAEKIIMAIRAPCAIRVGDRDLRLNIDASIGIAMFPRDGSTAQALVNCADTAMYVAKQGDTGYAFARQGSAE